MSRELNIGQTSEDIRTWDMERACTEVEKLVPFSNHTFYVKLEPSILRTRPEHSNLEYESPVHRLTMTSEGM